MADETIVAIYESADAARAAIADLMRSGIAADAIRVDSGPGAAAAESGADPGVAEPVIKDRGFFGRLLGGGPQIMEEHSYDPQLYERSLQHGDTILSVRVPLAMSAVAVEVLESHGPIDVDERAGAAAYGESNTDPAVSQDDQGDPLPLRTEGISPGDVPPVVIRPK